MAQTTDTKPLEIVEKRPLAIAASAWITGVSYFIGCVVAGGDHIFSVAMANRSSLVLIPLSYAAFIASVMLIQRYMQLSLTSANFGTPQKLVTTGIFAWSRNPIYAAFFMPLLALASLSWAAAATGLVAYIFLMEIFVIKPEEAELSQIFGQDFTDWKSTTRRWI